MRGMTKRGKILLGAGAVPLLLMLYLFAWPVPIEPIAWGAPVFNPDAWKTTGTLATAERIELSVTSTNSWPGSFDPNGERIWMVTSVQERAGHLYLGSATDHAWARIPVP